MGLPAAGYLFAVLAVSLCSCVQGQGYTWHMYVNNSPLDSEATKYLSNADQPLTIKCRYDITLKRSPPHLVRVVNGVSTVLTSIADPNAYTLTYSVPLAYRTGIASYECRTQDNSYYTYIIVSYQTDPTTTKPPTLPTTPPTKSPTPTSGGSSGSNGGSSGFKSTTPPTSGGSSFTGLNPLIYTISAVILLGSLAIVAIITCWIRARRSFNNRSLRSAQTAQDYFDHLSDSEFTPLTSAEFQASLQERPPTYIQSEQIESGEAPPPPETSTEQPAESTLSREDAAIIENLIGLNLLPEEGRHTRRPPRQQSVTPRQRSVPPTVMPRPPTEEETSSEGVEELRCAGERAQRLLTEQQSIGQLVQLETTNNTCY